MLVVYAETTIAIHPEFSTPQITVMILAIAWSMDEEHVYKILELITLLLPQTGSRDGTKARDIRIKK